MYAQRLGGDLAIINKRRVSGSQTEASHIIGDVKERDVLMMDDMISTAGTIASAAKLCKEHARRVFVGATHPVMCGPAIERLIEAPIDQVVVTDTIPVSEAKRNGLKTLHVLSVAELMGEAIHRIHNDESVSNLFNLA